MNEFLPNTALEVAGTVAAACVSLGIPYIAYKFKELSEIRVILHGIDGVESIQGIVGSVEMLNDEVEENSEELNEVVDKVDTIEESIENNKDDIQTAKRKAKDNEHELALTARQVGRINKRVDALFTDIKKRNGRD